ncbi:MAG: tetratricopeptide repeat protein [Ferruginibacter sp.]
MREFFIAAFYYLVLSFPLHAQDSITIKDAVQMKHIAENQVRDLNDLLNGIANSESPSSDVQEIIAESYSPGYKQIFLKPETSVEDDIDPTITTSSNLHDIKVIDYLKDLNVLYTKSNSNSIIFTNARISDPKRANDNHIFVKVYYNSFFKNACKTSDREYSINNRVAQIRMEKRNTKWTPYIESILFFNPDDTLNDVVNDITLITPFSKTDTSSQVSDSLSRATFIAEESEREKQEIIDEEKAKNKEYFDLIEKGDKAKDKNDFASALEAYNLAKDKKPYDRTATSRIIEVRRIQEANALSATQLYDGYIKDAGIQEKNRDYQKASKLYRKAIDLPVNENKRSVYENKIKELDDKWQIVSELNDKFEASNDYKSVIDDYDKAIKQNKTNSDLYLGRGKCYDKLTNLPKALKDYNQAFELDNTNLPALKLRAEVKKKQGDNFGALTDYKRYLNSYDEDISIYGLMSNLRLVIKADDFDKAIEDLDDGLKIDPKATELYYKKGLLLARKDDHKNAIKYFTIALSIDNANTLSYYQRGKSYLYFNRVKDAALDFDSARLTGLDSQNLKTIDLYAQKFSDSASKKFISHASDSAIILINDAIAINPLNSQYHFQKGEYLTSLDKNSEAIKSLNRAIDLKSDFQEALYQRGLAYFNIENYNAAALNYKKAIELNTQYFQAQKALGDSYFALKDYNNAALNYEAYIRIVTSSKNTSDLTTLAKVYNSLGKSYFIMNGADVRALNALKSAVKKNPNYDEAYYNIGLYYYTNKQLTDAITNMGKAISFNDKNAEWNYHLALAYQEKRDFQNAANNYNSTISLDSLKNYPKALYFLASCDYELQQYPAALTNYRKVQYFGLNSGINHFDYELGNVYLHLNKPDSALEYLHRAYLKDSADGNILYAIAVSQFQKGNKEVALIFFEKAFQTRQVDHKQIKNDQLIAILRDDKRFKALMKKYY